MAKTTHVWGIEIGQSALKALRCHLEGDNIVTDAFDFIEYPKILSQPEAEPEKLVAEALEQFLSRNEIKGCKVALSVPGQSGLAKFFKPPPMDAKKIPDIVKYEAKQQIPYDLNEVVWDYQTMPGAQIEDGFALESEVGLFAMKREAVFRAIKPLRTAGIEIDLIQMAPLAIYNMVAYDRLDERLQTVTFDPETPPPSTIVLSMGTDATDLIVTNGFRVWQRSMPLGGNHFTRQLTKDLKLTFAKAEHLKKNAMAADDPKLIFQAMRPVFNDMVTEVQRSVTFYKSLNKKAELGNVLVLGNSIKLPGLPPYLNKNLGYEVEVCDSFTKLTGSEVLNSPAFKENQLAFGVVYGLCLQLLGKGPVHTSLVPKEILTERLIRAKKPWAIAACAMLIVGLVINIYPQYRAWKYVHPDNWKGSIESASATTSFSSTAETEQTELKGKIDKLRTIGKEVGGNSSRRLLWLELLRTVSAAVPRDQRFIDKPYPAPSIAPYHLREDIHVEKVESKYFSDIAQWLDENRKKAYEEGSESRLELLGLKVKAPSSAEATGEEASTDGAAEATTDASSTEAAPADGTATDGWVIELKAYHYYRDPAKGPDWEKANFVRRSILHNLETGSVELPIDLVGNMATFTFKELGISYPLLIPGGESKVSFPNPEYYELAKLPMPGSNEGSGSGSGFSGNEPASEGSSGASAGLGGNSGAGETASNGFPVIKDKNGKPVPTSFEVDRFDFTIQFFWKPSELAARLEARKKAEEEAKAKAAEEAGAVEGETTEAAGESVASSL